jgi:hypothetical protein
MFWHFSNILQLRSALLECVSSLQGKTGGATKSSARRLYVFDFEKKKECLTANGGKHRTVVTT